MYNFMTEIGIRLKLDPQEALAAVKKSNLVVCGTLLWDMNKLVTIMSSPIYCKALASLQGYWGKEMSVNPLQIVSEANLVHPLAVVVLLSLVEEAPVVNRSPSAQVFYDQFADPEPLTMVIEAEEAGNWAEWMVVDEVGGEEEEVEVEMELLPDESDFSSDEEEKEDPLIPYIDAHYHPDTLAKRFGHKWQDPPGFYFLSGVGNHVNSRNFPKPHVVELPNLRKTIGCHPKGCSDYWKLVAPQLDTQTALHYAVAIGECGLDYSGRNFDAHQQKEVFSHQINYARDHHFPLVLHVRSGRNEGQAEKDTWEILLNSNLESDQKIHYHCYTGSYCQAKEWRGQFPGMLFGVSPKALDPQNIDFQEFIQKAPLEWLVVESDAPHLTMEQFPESHTPAIIPSILKHMSHLRGEPIELVAEKIVENTKQFYMIYI